MNLQRQWKNGADASSAHRAGRQPIIQQDNARPLPQRFDGGASPSKIPTPSGSADRRPHDPVRRGEWRLLGAWIVVVTSLSTVAVVTAVVSAMWFAI